MSGHNRLSAIRPYHDVIAALLASPSTIGDRLNELAVEGHGLSQRGHDEVSLRPISFAKGHSTVLEDLKNGSKHQ